MITYTIIDLNMRELQMQVRFSNDRDDLPDWFTYHALEPNMTETQIHNECTGMLAEYATLFWQNYEDTPEFVLNERSREIKDIQIEDVPDWNDLYERIESVYEEDEDTVYKSWIKVPYTEEERARNIRLRRQHQLVETDGEAVVDRTISQEMLDYRQALRDVTDQETFPHSVIWPIKPIG